MPHIPFTRLTLLVGTALGVAVLLILLVYLLKKMRRSRLGDEGLRQHAPRTQDEMAFAVAAFQGVIKDLKEQQRKLENLKQISDRRADTGMRQVVVITREMSEGLLRISTEGTIVFANSAARALLGISALSYPSHYTHTLGADPDLCESIRSCLETGATTRLQKVNHISSDGKVRPILASVVPLTLGDNRVDEVLCFLSSPLPAGSTPEH